jgi:hypothetical protein
LSDALSRPNSHRFVRGDRVDIDPRTGVDNAGAVGVANLDLRYGRFRNSLDHYSLAQDQRAGIGDGERRRIRGGFVVATRGGDGG